MTSPSTDRRFAVNSSLAIKAPCHAVTTAAITLSGEQTVNGVALTTGMRCLVNDQANAVHNGIYMVDTSDWERGPDFDGARDVTEGTLVTVLRSDGGLEIWRLTSDSSPSNPITIGTDEIAFELFLSVSGTDSGSLSQPFEINFVVTPEDSAIAVEEMTYHWYPRFAGEFVADASPPVLSVVETTSATALAFDIKINGTSIFSTTISHAAGQQKSTAGGATQPVINEEANSFAAGDEVSFHCTNAGDGNAELWQIAMLVRRNA